jgi:truncated hemoglobin YjbI
VGYIVSREQWPKLKERLNGHWKGPDLKTGGHN